MVERGGMSDVLTQAPLPAGTQLVGISVDGVWCHQAFARSRGIEYPLLALEDLTGRNTSD
jgi:peroxiredoxin